jgi:formylglycine-generating enzyme required for sulfatase activity
VCCLLCGGQNPPGIRHGKEGLIDTNIASFLSAGLADDPQDGMAKFFGADRIKIGINDPNYKLHGEFPYRVAKLGHFMMDKYPVTIRQFM